MPLAEPHLKLSEVAARFRVSLDTVRAWVASGELNAVETTSKRGAARRRYVVPLVEVLAFEELRKVRPAPKPSRRRPQAPPHRTYKWV